MTKLLSLNQHGQAMTESSSTRQPLLALTLTLITSNTVNLRTVLTKSNLKASWKGGRPKSTGQEADQGLFGHLAATAAGVIGVITQKTRINRMNIQRSNPCGP